MLSISEMSRNGPKRVRPFGVPIQNCEVGKRTDRVFLIEVIGQRTLLSVGPHDGRQIGCFNLIASVTELAAALVFCSYLPGHT